MLSLSIEEGLASPDPWPHLFNSTEYFSLHAAAESKYFRLVRGVEEVAVVHFTDVGNGRWRSPARGTYAGLQWAPDLDLEGVKWFLDAVEHRLAQCGAQALEMVPAPMAHDAQHFSQLLYLALASGWLPLRTDINQSLVVTGQKLEQRMNRANQKRLRKCRRDGFTSSLLPREFWRDAHELLAINRADKGRSLSMTFAELEAMDFACPGTISVFGCRSPYALAAAAICLRVSADCYYVFAWGHAREFSTWSPVVQLADAIYVHCQESQVGLLDVGTSTNGPVPDYGLMRFKRGLGFEDSLKVRIEKVVAQ